MEKIIRTFKDLQNDIKDYQDDVIDITNRLIYRALKTPDGTILATYHTHDYKTYVDKNGETYTIDGGLENYYRTSVNNEPAEMLELYLNDDIEKLRKYVSRGTFDSNGNRIYVTMEKLSNDHISNILLYNFNLYETGKISEEDFVIASILYNKELRYRSQNNILIEDYNYE